MKLRKVLLSVGMVFVFFAAMSQNGTMKGFVYDKATGEACIFANVSIQGTNLGAATDVNGYFSINQIPAGKHTVIFTYVGYDSVAIDIDMVAGKLISEKVYMTKSAVLLQETVISAEREERQTQVRTSIIKVTPAQIKRLPTVGSDPDLAQYLQVLPGVIFTGDQGGQLYIRGGAPIHNLVLLDGMTVYNPFHSIGLFSVFDSDIIQSTDVYTGGFPADYGGRVSSVMDIRMREGNKKRFSGVFSASTFGTKILLEGPLKKFKENEGSASFIISAKTSFLEQSSKLLYTYINEQGLPFNYTDLYGKLAINSRDGSKFNLFGFRFNDNVSYQEISDLHWNSYGLGGNLVLVPTGSSVMIKANLSYSDYRIEMSDMNSAPRYSEMGGFNIGFDFLYFLGKNEFVWGLQTLGFKTDFRYYNAVNRMLVENENSTEFAVYARYKHNFGNLIIEPSMRLHYYATMSEVSPEPRLGVKYNVSETFRLKFAGGLYSQNLIAANSDQDVVNLFYGFLTGSNNIPDTFNGEEVTSSLQKSQHVIAGFEYDITNRLTANIEGYLKNFSQITNINRNKIYDDNAANYDKPDNLKKDLIIESGRAYGVDFLLKYDSKQVYLWLVYSLGWIERFDGIITYSPHFDRRHNVNFVGTFKFGNNLLWNISARWNYGSGFPFTPTAGYYEQMPFYTNLNLPYWETNGNLGIIYGDINSSRLPDYHRFDVTVQRTFHFTERVKLEVVLSCTNVYNRQNIFYFDRVDHERVDQLPIMPSLGLSLTF
ncbi:MAG: carboxypeptidase-like regulatory domain-containing protein [Bacteroidales bacterium]|nr:carboxypeptidase-like regulatory domain-containing protein [Bacteroidales bacterium]HOY38941.1 carboxypeptidase-like regulatory domain-containing protein [Bacteroidales bacterium]HQP03624.1 carboxypeptidase-like regulatory domain-containing protein [Bacteroidales bacterium]